MPDEMSFRELDLVRTFAAPREGREAQRGLGAGSTVVTFADLGDKTEVTNHFAGGTTAAVEVFMRQGTGEQLDKLADALAG